MKKITLTLAFLVLVIASSQAQTKYTKTEKLLNIPRIEVVNYYVGDSLENQMVYWGWQNAKYQHIVDIGSTSAHSQDQLDNLILNLEKALELCKTGIGWKSEDGNFGVSENSNFVYVYSGSKYTYMSPSVAKKVLTTFRSFKFQ